MAEELYGCDGCGKEVEQSVAEQTWQIGPELAFCDDCVWTEERQVGNLLRQVVIR